jgi:MoaA/NifB/PqqE/SkfB family radical SAM enzyme
MKLNDIGFYTLSDDRAKNVSVSSDLQRCEIILTDKCNFKCPYCRGIKSDLQGDMSFDDAKHLIDLWMSNNLHNVRFSGGEPTLWKGLLDLVKYTKSFSCVDHIALSTNGSADRDFYKQLIDAGVNDFSISLDACCSSTAQIMAGKSIGFEKIISNVEELAKLAYVSLGVVLEEKNISELQGIIEFGHNLGVKDIRIIPSAQWDHHLIVNVTDDLLTHPILKYRVDNIRSGRHVRGLQLSDSRKCSLVLDDMAVLNNYHFPCIIYMREQGNPIGSLDNKSIEEIRAERFEWMSKHDCYKDSICNKNCLDVCIV